MGKYIGYVSPTNISQYEQYGLDFGDYVTENSNHNNGEFGLYVIQTGEVICNVTENGGEALFTGTKAHALTSGMYVGTKYSNLYYGNWVVDVLTTTTFKIRKRAGAARRTFQGNERLTIFPIASSHNEKNFSVGAGSDAYSRYQDFLVSGNTTDLIGGYAYNNHNANGALKYTHGGTGNYSGPVGKKWAIILPDKLATVENSGGDALFTLSNHQLTTGWYLMGKGYTHYGAVNAPPYSGYACIQVITANTFKLRRTASGPFLQYVDNTPLKFSVTIGACKMTAIDLIGTELDRVLITNRGGQAIFHKRPESNATYGWEFINGARYFDIDGEYDPVLQRGHEDYLGEREGYTYRQGKYGFWFMFYNENTNNSLLNIGGGASNFTKKGIEFDGGNRGFAGDMAKTDDQPHMNMGEIVTSNCYIHDVEGEGIYHGKTSENTPGAARKQHWIHNTIYNCNIIRTGVELLQAGQCKDGTNIFNNVIMMSTNTRFRPFHVGQNNAMQLKGASGIITFKNNVVGVGTVNSFLCQSDRGDETDPLTTVLNNNFYYISRLRVAYFDFSGALNPTLKVINCDFKSCFPQDTDRNESQPDNDGQAFLMTDTMTKFIMSNTRFDLDMNARGITETGVTSNFNWPDFRREAVPDIEFECSGYENSDLVNYAYWIDEYHPTRHASRPGEPVHYTTADKVHWLGYHYHCKLEHDGTPVHPPLDTVHWERMVWDVNGKNMLHPDYNGIPYSYKPPDNWLIKKNNYHNIVGRGLLDNPQPDTSTFFYWEGARNTIAGRDETFTIPLPIFKSKDIDFELAKKILRPGDWVRRVRMKDGTERFNSQWLRLQVAP